MKDYTELLKELDESDCRQLQHHYTNIMGDTILLAQMAEARKIGMDEAYAACKEKVKELGKLGTQRK